MLQLVSPFCYKLHYTQMFVSVTHLCIFANFQILFICGLACVIGLERTFRFFFQRHKARASLAFFGGIAVVLFGWPLIGMCLETYGFVLLFR